MLTERDAVRLWSHVIKTSTCWIWMGAISTDAYGRMRAKLDNGEQVTITPHRAAGQLALGPPSAGLTHLHDCEVRLCCRVMPGHVRLGTQAENVQQAVDRGRRSTAGDLSNGLGPVALSRAIQDAVRDVDAGPEELATRLAAVLPPRPRENTGVDGELALFEL